MSQDLSKVARGAWEQAEEVMADGASEAHTTHWLSVVQLLHKAKAMHSQAHTSARWLLSEARATIGWGAVADISCLERHTTRSSASMWIDGNQQ